AARASSSRDPAESLRRRDTEAPARDRSRARAGESIAIAWDVSSAPTVGDDRGPLPNSIAMPRALLLSSWVIDHYGDALVAAAPGVPRVVLRDGKLDGDPAAVEVAYFSGDIFPDRVREFILALRDAPALRWMHTFSAGVDNPFFGQLRARGIRLTTSSGAHAV